LEFISRPTSAQTRRVYVEQGSGNCPRSALFRKENDEIKQWNIADISAQ
jgi:hypothetical protein